MGYHRRSRTSGKRRTKFFRTLVRVSVEMASISDWMAVSSSAIVCRIFWKILPFKHPYRKSQGFKSDEVEDRENPSSNSAGYVLERTRSSKTLCRNRCVSLLVCEVWQRLVETKLNSLESYPSGNGQIRHSADGTKHQNWSCHHKRFPMRCWERPQSAVLNFAQCFLDFPPVLHLQILAYEQIHYVYIHLHASCSFRLFNNPVNSVSRWCNTNKDLSMVMALHRNTRTARTIQGFDNKHFLIRHMWRHLVTQSSVANGMKQISQTYRLIHDRFI
jgi:hypothetical protein